MKELYEMMAADNMRPTAIVTKQIVGLVNRSKAVEPPAPVEGCEECEFFGYRCLECEENAADG